MKIKKTPSVKSSESGFVPVGPSQCSFADWDFQPGLEPAPKAFGALIMRGI